MENFFLLFIRCSNYKNANMSLDIRDSLLRFDTKLEGSLKQTNDQLSLNRKDYHNISKDNREELTNTLKDVKKSIDERLKNIQEDNTKQLDKMRNTVDEKLQKTLNERISKSFEQVSKQLADVHKGLGDMQSIASDVGGLKKILGNVKTRGVIGEYQIKNILEEILPKEHYAENVKTKVGSNDYVEFAIKLPGKTDDKNIWLPIDSKFRMSSYERLNEQYDIGDKEGVIKAKKVLIDDIKRSAKEISSLYLDPPNTTNFAIMYLPYEGLYAEVLRDPGIINELSNKYKINVTGPSTLAAFLNSLQMGFKTLAVQKRSSEVWDILEAVKSEFQNFGNHLETVDAQLKKASKTINSLRTTRTNVMQRKMKDINILESPKKDDDVLQLPDFESHSDIDSE